MDTKEREWFIFYNSFRKAIKELPKENQLEIYNAIAEYSFTLEEPNLTGLSKTIWILIKPQLEANNRRYLNWIKPKIKQEESKWEANNKQEESKWEGKEKEKENVKEKDIKEEFINYSKLYQEDNKNIWSYLLYVFLDLWYIPAKDETLETFRLWFKEKIIDSHKINWIWELRGIINNYHSYNLEQDKKPKNFKASFLNNPLLSNLKK